MRNSDGIAWALPMASFVSLGWRGISNVHPKSDLKSVSHSVTRIFVTTPAMKVEISDRGKCVENRYGIAMPSLPDSPLLTNVVFPNPLFPKCYQLGTLNGINLVE